jgi:NTP pyrophosphatase (non-canonical NTP hydrolase)
MTLEDWSACVLQWAHDRNLVEGSTPLRQMVKLNEEMVELLDAIAKNDEAELKDAIGDCCVVLRIIAATAGVDFRECIEGAWNEIKDRKGRMENGIFVKEPSV